MKRTKRKHILFSEEQWKKVCHRAGVLHLRTTAYIRNMALYREYKYSNGGEVAYSMRLINRIGTDLRMIMRAAEKTDSKYIDRLRKLYERYEVCKQYCFDYFSGYVNHFD